MNQPGGKNQQPEQSEWQWQWERFENDSAFMFGQWIYPLAPEDFRGKSVLDAGCGGGQHLTFIAPYAARALGVDLNSTEAARHNTAHLPNVTVQKGDIATMDLGEQFDIVYCVGVIQHTHDPDKVFANLLKHVKTGGRLAIWVYAHEGNTLVRLLVEAPKKYIFARLPRPLLRAFAYLITALIYVPVYTIYLLPLSWLPYYEYFKAWRQFTFARNVFNVFDKLNAPTTYFFKREQLERWFNARDFANPHISFFQGVSWRGSGTKK